MRKNVPYLNGSAVGGISTMSMEYLGGFHYQGTTLKFFPTAEGYVQRTGTQYSYVYNYTDHLGNVRLSYAEDPGNIGTLKILEESHYYPFGLKHANYNSDELAFREKDPGPGIMLMAAPVDPGPQFDYNYKYQGQERQDELGLNWDSFKWRNYDYAIGRFMSIDPLTEQYHTWSPYAFSGNRVIDARELEGLEPYILFSSEKKAKVNFGQQYNGKSIKANKEYGSNIYKKTASDGRIYFYYDEPNVGNTHSVKLPSTWFEDGERTATIHTHAAYSEGYENNSFSDTDKENAKKRGVNNNVVTPSGFLLEYDIKTDTDEVISDEMPSDPKDPQRRNKIDPNPNPEPAETKPIIPKKEKGENPGSAGPYVPPGGYPSEPKF